MFLLFPAHAKCFKVSVCSRFQVLGRLGRSRVVPRIVKIPPQQGIACPSFLTASAPSLLGSSDSTSWWHNGGVDLPVHHPEAGISSPRNRSLKVYYPSLGLVVYPLPHQARTAPVLPITILPVPSAAALALRGPQAGNLGRH